MTKRGQTIISPPSTIMADVTSSLPFTGQIPSISVFSGTTLCVSDQSGSVLFYNTATSPTSFINKITPGTTSVTAMDTLNGKVYMTLFGSTTLYVYDISAQTTAEMTLPEAPAYDTACIVAMDTYVLVTLSASIAMLSLIDENQGTFTTGTKPAYMVPSTIKSPDGVTFGKVILVYNKGDGTITVFTDNSSGFTIPTQIATWSIETTTATKFVVLNGHAYILDAEHSRVNIMYLPTDFGDTSQTLQYCALTGVPRDICVLNGLVYVTATDGTVTSIPYAPSVSNITPTASVSVGPGPRFMTSVGNSLYVTLDASANLIKLNTSGSLSVTSALSITNPATAITSLPTRIYSLEGSGNTLDQITADGTLLPPTTLVGAASVNAITMTWTPSGNAVTGYAIYLSSNGGTTFTLNSTVSKTTTLATVSGLANGTTYLAKIQSVNGSTTSASYSPVLTLTTPLGKASAPSNLTGRAGDQAISVSWTASPSTVTGYIVFISVGPSSYAAAAYTGSSTTSATILNTRENSTTRLTNGQSYQLYVAAYNGNTNNYSTYSTYTNVITVTPVPRSLPGAPTNCVATSSASGTVRLEWTPPTNSGTDDITSYTIAKIVNGTQTVVSTNIDISGTSAVLTGLVNGTAYTFVAAAVSYARGPFSAPSNSIVTSAAMAGVATFLSSGSTTSFTTSLQTTASTNPAQAILDARSAIANTNSAGALTPTQQQELTVAAITSINSTGSALSTPMPDTASMVATLASVTTSSINTALPTVSVIPSFSTGSSPHTAPFDFAAYCTVDGVTNSYAQWVNNHSIYVVFELPISVTGSVYQLALTYGGASLTLTYDGTQLLDQNGTAYTAASTLAIGSVNFPLLGLGSFGGGSPSHDSSLSLLAVDSVTLTAPYAYTVPSNESSALLHIDPTDAYASYIVNDASGAPVITGMGDMVGVLPLVTGSNAFTIHVLAADGSGSAVYPLTVINPAPNRGVPCFPAGTRILTASGYKAVETLVQGELVLTADGRQVPVKIYGKHLPVTTSATAPYRVPKGTFGLQNDLILSPDHAFLIRKGVWMIPKRAALLSDRVEQIGVGSPVTYYHLECPSYLRDNLVVDGAVVESYGGKQQSKSPYTYSESLKGYTRAAATKNLTKA